MAAEQGRVAECHNKTEHNGEHSKEEERKKVETKFAEPAAPDQAFIAIWGTPFIFWYFSEKIKSIEWVHYFLNGSWGKLLCFGVDSFDTFINQNEIMLDDQMSIAHDLEQE